MKKKNKKRPNSLKGDLEEVLSGRGWSERGDRVRES
jgi:hypothetical protein